VEDVDIICAGINHQTWYISVKLRGRDVPQAELLERFLAHERFSVEEKVRLDVMKRFGCYSTESNGHLSEYLPWYRKDAAEIGKWIDLGSWINGETGGYLRVCTESRNWFETEFPNWMKEQPPQFGERSGEHGSYIIEALETGRIYRGHFNAVNNGCISNLPGDAVVEAPGYVDRNGVSMPPVGDLPLGCAAICSASVSAQRLALEAAVRGDSWILKQALMMDPLTGAVCTTAQISQMADEMLIAGERWLPQYAASGAIAEAKARRASGDWIEMPEREGSNRLKVKSVAELAEERERADAMAKASEKAGF
jgi:alpha-galactosidase